MVEHNYEGHNKDSEVVLFFFTMYVAILTDSSPTKLVLYIFRFCILFIDLRNAHNIRTKNSWWHNTKIYIKYARNI